jgi:hypothetical protein
MRYVQGKNKDVRPLRSREWICFRCASDEVIPRTLHQHLHLDCRHECERTNTQNDPYQMSIIIILQNHPFYNFPRQTQFHHVQTRVTACLCTKEPSTTLYS